MAAAAHGPGMVSPAKECSPGFLWLGDHGGTPQLGHHYGDTTMGPVQKLSQTCCVLLQEQSIFSGFPGIYHKFSGFRYWPNLAVYRPSQHGTGHNGTSKHGTGHNGTSKSGKFLIRTTTLA